MFFNKKFNCLKKWYDFINEFENIRFNSKQIIDLIMARRQDTTLGELDFQAVQSEVNDACSSKRESTRNSLMLTDLTLGNMHLKMVQQQQCESFLKSSQH